MVLDIQVFPHLINQSVIFDFNEVFIVFSLIEEDHDELMFLAHIAFI